MSQLAKISSKGQIAILADVRKKMHLQTGDDGRIWLQRIEPLDLDYLTATSGTLSEWNNAEDDEAYCEL